MKISKGDKVKVALDKIEDFDGISYDILYYIRENQDEEYVVVNIEKSSKYPVTIAIDNAFVNFKESELILIQKKSLTIKDLELTFYKAKKNNIKYVCIVTRLENESNQEVIIYHKDSFESKIQHIKNTYNNDLTHKFIDGLKIIHYCYGNSFDEIEIEMKDNNFYS